MLHRHMTAIHDLHARHEMAMGDGGEGEAEEPEKKAA